MMRYIILYMMIILTITACSSGDEQQGDLTVIPTQPTLTGNVDIVFPMSGSIIYAETIYLEGTASELPAEGFQIRLLTPDDTVIAQSNIQPDDETWSVEIVHQYVGDPTELTIMAGSVDSNNPLDYDLVSVMLSDSDLRPDGVFGEILAPTSAQTVGGDTIPVTGRGSGFFENTFLLILEAPNGTLISETIVTMTNPYFIDDVLWEAEIDRAGYAGNATLRMVYQDTESGEEITVDEVTIEVGSVAG